MSYLHCPYCEIKEDAKVKKHYESLQPIDGACSDCGAWLDKGQAKVDVNGYIDIYKGVVNVIEDVVQQVNNLMDYLDVDTKVDGETPCVRLNTSEIVRTIFMPYVGGTTACNMKNVLGIEEDKLEFEIKAEQHEW